MDRGAQHPFGQWPHQGRASREWKEGGRRQQAALGVLPAKQCLDADDTVVAERNLGLVVQNQLVLFDRPSQLDEHAELGDVVLVAGDRGRRSGTASLRAADPGMGRA